MAAVQTRMTMMSTGKRRTTAMSGMKSVKKLSYVDDDADDLEEFTNLTDFVFSDSSDKALDDELLYRFFPASYRYRPEEVVVKAEHSRYDMSPQIHADALRMSAVTVKSGVSDSLKARWSMRSSLRYSQPSTVPAVELPPMIRKWKPEVVVRLLASKPHLGFATRIALALLEQKTYKSLHVIYAEANGMRKRSLPEDVPPNVFSWDFNDFKERRTMANVVWVDLLIRALTPRKLEEFKFVCDLEELFRYIQLIFKPLVQGDTEPKVDLMEYLEETYEFLTVHKTVTKELEVNARTFKENLNRALALEFHRRDTKGAKRKKQLQDEIQNADVFDPIEVRYQVEWFTNKAEQGEYKIRAKLLEIQKQIDSYKQQISRDQYCSQCVCNALYTDTQKYKTRINNLTDKLDIDDENVEIQIRGKNLALEKLREQRKFMEEQVQRFHEEIALMEEYLARKRQREREKMALRWQAEQEAARKAALRAKRRAKMKKP